MSSSYDTRLVAISVLIGTLACYVALVLATRAFGATRRARLGWIGAGAFALGIGVWSMHFIGMLAYHVHAPGGIGVPISYDLPLLVLSAAVAVLGSALAIEASGRTVLTPRATFTVGWLLASAIVGMHYVGMAAMRMPVRLSYARPTVLASLAVALGASVAAIWLARHLRDRVGRLQLGRQCGVVGLMGLAIAGTHYTGMAALRFGPMPFGGPLPPSPGLGTPELATPTATAALLVLVAALAGSLIDRWHRDRIRDATRRTEDRYQSVLESVHAVVFEIDPAGRWAFVSPAWTAITGGTTVAMVGTSAAATAHAEDQDAFAAALDSMLTGTREQCQHELRVTTGTGQLRWLEMRAQSTIDAAGQATGIFGTLIDVTDRKTLEAQLAHQAFHDPLTGLANRVLFRDRSACALARHGRRRGGAAVLFLDLDRFKSVNDSLGHDEGDRVLVTVAERLLNATRGCDTVARLGGDEFAVLLDDARTAVEAVTVAERIIAAIGRPIPVAGRYVRVGCSIGIALARTEDGPEELLRNGDLAMYQAKHRGRGGYEIFAPALHAASVDRLALEEDLDQALERQEFCLVYQPIVGLSDGRVFGVEALVRWVHPTRGFVLPAAFIPLAESTGLIVPLGRWILGEACRQMAAWRPPPQHGAARISADGELVLTVNISGRQLEDATLVDDVSAALAYSGLAPNRLVLEITESVVMLDVEAALERLHALKTLGVQLAIDDFGTGYSSLSSLQQFPVDILKIDKSFVDRVARGGADAALARMILALGETLSLRCVAEGIEDAEQRRHLEALGCTLGQGYLFARPLSPSAFAGLLRRQPASVAPVGAEAMV